MKISWQVSASVILVLVSIAYADPPIGLEVEQVAHPLGLDLLDYILRWEVKDAKTESSAYQILIASDPKKLQAGYGDFWDSGRVHDRSSRKVLYLGQALPRGAKVWWAVRTWNQQGVAGPFSEPATFTTPPLKTRTARTRSAQNLAGKLVFMDGKFNKGLAFNGTGPIISASVGAATTTGLTMSAWIRPTKVTDTWQTIIRKEDGPQRRLLAIGKTDNIAGLWIGLGIGGRYQEFGASIPTKTLLDKKWHHVAGTFDGKQIVLFLDGKQIGRKAIAGKLDTSGSAPMMIGSSGAGQGEFFNGGLDDVRLYRRALDVIQIAGLTTDAKPLAAKDLAHWWKLDGTLEDQIGVKAGPPKHRVVLLGNALVANMAKYGYLEAMLSAGTVPHPMTVRNLGWPADDVFGTARSEFGSPKNTRSWKPPAPTRGFGFTTLIRQLTQAQPETVILGYGTETAFYDDENFERFKQGYAHLLDQIQKQASHVILIGPPRQENLGPPMPDPAARNAKLERTTQFLADLAQKRKLRFINLYQTLIAAKSPKKFTENGVHLNEQGYKRLAAIVGPALLGHRRSPINIELGAGAQVIASQGARINFVQKTEGGFHFDLLTDRVADPLSGASATLVILDALKAYRLKINGKTVIEAGADQWKQGVRVSIDRQTQRFDELRRAINDKNRIFGYRLRPLNKTYIFLFRRHEMGHLAHEMDDFERLVEQQESLISKFRVPTSDRFVLEVIDPWKPPRRYPDHEVPKVIPKPDIAAELKAFTLPEGMQINLFASNPMIANPINVNWDTRGRMWVSTSSTYPHIKPGHTPNDRIIILEDTDHDGKADKFTIFAEGLLVPHSVMPVKNGAYVCSTTQVLHLIDHDGDDRADERRVVYEGFGNADVHHMIHGLRWAPWGDLHFVQSIYINSFVETPWGSRRLNGSGVWRFRPETQRLEIFSRGMVNPWGFTFNRWGRAFATDGAGGSGPHFVFPGSAFPSAVGARRVLSGLIRGKPKNTAAEFVTGSHLPEAWRGSLLANDFRANRTVRYELKPSGSGYTAREVQTVIHSKHKSFRPVDLKIGPDGALYVVDWYNPIIDHGEVDFHHPQRDKTHGRIWRLTVKDRPLVKKPTIYGAKIGDLLELLKSPEQWTRNQARRELSARPAKEVLPGLDAWEQKLDPNDPQFEHHRTEALWLKGCLRTPDPKLLRKVFEAQDHRARAAAARMVSQWHDQVPQLLSILKRAVRDVHPAVRLEAVNALREVGSLEACETAMFALDQDLDKDLNFALWLTARDLQSRWISALHAGRPVFGGRINHLAFALEAAESRDALKTMTQLLGRKDLPESSRANVLRIMAGLGGQAELNLVLREASQDPKTSIWQAIAEAAQFNRAAPSETQGLLKLLDHTDLNVRLAALNLIGRWRVDDKGKLQIILTDKNSTQAVRRAAATAMAKLGQYKLLSQLASSNESLQTRVATIEAWASVNPKDAAPAASKSLVEIQTPSLAQPIFKAFIGRQDGPSLLAGALAKQKLKSTVAAAGIDLLRESGRDLSALEKVLIRVGSLEPLPAILKAPQRTALLKEAAISGNAARGEKIYRRDTLACARCHALAGLGGQLGPDLGSLGTYMTGQAILESLLNPNTAVKQGYETQFVRRNDGQVFAGTLQRKTDRAVLLRTPSGVVSIPLNQIDSMRSSPVSLMPPGLTQQLRRDELVDLLRFLTELGKKKS